MTARHTPRWKSITAAAVLAAASAGPAHAIVYQGNFDPWFNLSTGFTPDGFFYAGVAYFDVGSGCLLNNGTVDNYGKTGQPAIDCPNGSITLISASIDLYLSSAGASPGDHVKASIPFETLTYGLVIPQPAPSPVTSIDVVANQLASITTGELGGVYSIDMQQWFSLSFSSLGATLSTAVCTENHAGEGNEEGYRYADYDEYCTVPAAGSPQRVTAGGAAGTTSFAVSVPEPGSLALVGSALALAGIAAARRRRNA